MLLSSAGTSSSPRSALTTEAGCHGCHGCHGSPPPPGVFSSLSDLVRLVDRLILRFSWIQSFLTFYSRINLEQSRPWAWFTSRCASKGAGPGRTFLQIKAEFLVT